jgi:hypothetical protein
MPCGCQIKLEEYPETAEWGPLFWQLLHGLSLRAGSLTEPLFQVDEVRTWMRLLDAIGNTLPCDVCRSHYSTWRKEHTLDLLEIPYMEVGPWIRDYFFRLHNEINEGNGKPVAGIEVLETYKSVNIRKVLSQLEPVLKAAMAHYAVSFLGWLKFKQYVLTLNGFYY